MPTVKPCISCGNLRTHRALDMCDPCYQKHRYWADPEKNRAAARRSVTLTRLKRRGMSPKAAMKMIELMEASREDNHSHS
jgi:hypothetical protein